jgi:SNF2 family DNA or RNA helicase
MKPLHAKDTFDRWISNPIRDNVQEGLRKLRILVEATCLRRTKSSISQALPPPTIHEEKVDLHPYDRDLYDFFESEAAKNAADPANNSKTGREKKNVLSLIHNLRRICDHGEDLLPASDIEAWRLQRSQGANLQMLPGLNDSIGSYCQTPPSAKVKKLIYNIRLEQVNNLEEAMAPPVKRYSSRRKHTNVANSDQRGFQFLDEDARSCSESAFTGWFPMRED